MGRKKGATMEEGVPKADEEELVYGRRIAKGKGERGGMGTPDTRGAKTGTRGTGQDPGARAKKRGDRTGGGPARGVNNRCEQGAEEGRQGV